MYPRSSKNRRNYWVGQQAVLPPTADEWLDRANEVPGSWWKHWDRWLAGFADGEVDAPVAYGGNHYSPIEPAPGRYVVQKAQDVTAGG